VSAGLGDADPVAALSRVSDLLEQRGWCLTDRVAGAPGTDASSSAGGVTIGADRRLFAVWVDARPSKISLLGRSPLYRSPAEPGSAFVVEPR
jgi:hypothetical protein